MARKKQKLELFKIPKVEERPKIVFSDEGYNEQKRNPSKITKKSRPPKKKDSNAKEPANPQNPGKLSKNARKRIARETRNSKISNGSNEKEASNPQNTGKLSKNARKRIARETRNSQISNGPNQNEPSNPQKPGKLSKNARKRIARETRNSKISNDSNPNSTPKNVKNGKKKGKKRKISMSREMGPPPKHPKKRMNIRLKPFTAHKPNLFWKMLQLRGPFLPIQLLSYKIFAHRALLHLIREICEQLYQNFEHYQQNELQALGAARTLHLVNIVQEMSHKTMRVQVGGVTVVFETENFIPHIQNLLMGSAAEFYFDECTVLLEQLRELCEQRKVEVTEAQLAQVRNVFARYFIYIQMDLIESLMEFPSKKPPKRRRLETIPPDGYLLRSSPTALVTFSDLPKLTFQMLSRSSLETSLWNMIPCEGKVRLLEHVFTYGLLECLPGAVREFLEVWLLEVRNKMRKCLNRKELQTTVEQVLGSESRDIGWGSPSIAQFMSSIYKRVLNNSKFNVFNDTWLSVLLENLGDPTSTMSSGQRRWAFLTEDVATSPGFSRLEALLPEGDASYHLLRHVRIHLFNFFLKFCYHTIRMLFTVDIKKRLMRYDGVVEFRKTPSYKSIDKDEQELPRVERKKVVWEKDAQRARGSFLDQHYRFEHQHQIQNHNDAQNAPTPPESYPKIPFFPIHPSPIYTPPLATKKEPTPSEGSLQIEEDEGVPKKWRDAYRLLLEWNQELMGQLNSVKDRFHKFC